MSIWWSLHLRREAASVPLARRLLLGTMETAGVDPDISYDLSVALSEACANAVEHGGDDSGDTVSGSSTGAYRVTAYLDGEKCRIEVADSGPGFPRRRARRTAPVAATASAPAAYPHQHQPPSAQSEHGRGLGLIEELTDHADFRNTPGRGAVVSFDKILKWREDALLKAS
jgi:serine/threonine-protein kinase RsbW